MRALVTGAAGFIGSSVVDQLLADGWQVVGLDNFDPYYDVEQKRRNLRRALASTAYSFLEGDVCEAEKLREAFALAQPDVVVHLAARAGVRRSVEDPFSYLRVNELGGLNILEACRQHAGVPLVFASTSSVYGAAASIPFREADPAMFPLSPYAASKRSAELMVHAYHHLHQQPAAILRFFTVYGPRGRPDMALWKFSKALRSYQEIRLHGETTARDFTFIGDIVRGVINAISWVRDSRGCDTFNLGRSEPVLVRRFIEVLAEALGVEPRLVLGNLEPSESAVTCADVSKASAVLGYHPQVSLEEGVAHWVRWVDRSEEAPAELRVQNTGQLDGRPSLLERSATLPSVTGRA